MADNALKTPLSKTIGSWTDRRANDFQQPQAKGMPCTVTAISKDIVTVKFDGSNGVWTIPTMKMPQAFSPYGRDATQVGDKGYASPADYYMGGISDLGGGTANWSMRGNLTPLVFHPASRVNSEARDYNQYTGAGGPNGMIFIQKANQPSDNQDSGTTPTPSRAVLKRMLGWGTASRRAWIGASPRDGSSNGSTAQDNRSYIQMDKNGRHSLRSQTGKHSTTIDENAKKITLRVPAQGSEVWIGGNGVQPELYGPLVLASPYGLMVTCNAMGKWQQQDEKDELQSASDMAKAAGSGSGSGGSGGSLAA